MKYSVMIKNKSYIVEIEDINTRPVIAHVEGQSFEVIPDTNPAECENKPEVKTVTTEVKSFDLRNNGANKNVNEMTAPLPGVVIELFVKAGDVIEAGQVLLHVAQSWNEHVAARIGPAAEKEEPAAEAICLPRPHLGSRQHVGLLAIGPLVAGLIVKTIAAAPRLQVHHLGLQREAGLPFRHAGQKNGQSGSGGHEIFSETAQIASSKATREITLRGQDDFDPIVTSIWGGDVAARSPSLARFGY